MKLVLQRVSRAKVTVDGTVTGEILQGYMILVGLKVGDTAAQCATLADKVALLRVFEDDAGKMNRSILDIKGSVLAISQFTLYADTQKGRRPSFLDAMPPEPAKALYESFCQLLRDKGITVAAGIFGASMQVELVNTGPVTILLEA